MFETEAFWIIVESFVGPVPSRVKKLLEFLDLCNLGIIIPMKLNPQFLDWEIIAKQVIKSSGELLDDCEITSLTVTDRKVCQMIYETMNQIQGNEFVRLMQVCRVIVTRRASVENADATPPLNRSNFYEIESFWAIVESLIGPVPSRFKMLLQKLDLCNIGMLALDSNELTRVEVDCQRSSESSGNYRFVVSDLSLFKQINTALKGLGQTEFVRNMRICKDIFDRPVYVPFQDDKDDDGETDEEGQDVIEESSAD